MKSHRMAAYVFPTVAAVIVAATAAGCFLTARAVREFHTAQVKAELEAEARVAADLVAARPAAAAEKIDSLAKYLGRLTGVRFTFIGADGKVWGDSEADPAVMENHSDRPEFTQALAGEVGVSRRRSPSVGKAMLYVAVPKVVAGDTLVVRAAKGLSEISTALIQVVRDIVFAGLVAAVAAALALTAVVDRATRPLRELRDTAQEFAAGKFNRRMVLRGPAELRELAENLNRLSERTSLALAALTRIRAFLETVLSEVTEGVLVVDSEDKVAQINPAAARMLQANDAVGKPVLEVVRNPELLRGVTSVLNQGGRFIVEMVIPSSDEPRLVTARVSEWRDADGRCCGALVMLNDHTELKRLEKVRQDFAANVAHELRTPVTSIKGFVETLQNGALDDRQTARRFVDIISRQLERLEKTVEGMLALAGLESDIRSGRIELTLLEVSPVVLRAVQNAQATAAETGVAIEAEPAEEVWAEIDEVLLERALANLLDNAIRFSRPGGKVLVSVKAAGDEAEIAVQDWGEGIAPNHLERIFERFYRTENARSRHPSGAGLGLAIVKHIMTAHRGRVTVESTLGMGTRFVLHLPRCSGEKADRTPMT